MVKIDGRAGNLAAEGNAVDFADDRTSEAVFAACDQIVLDELPPG